MSPDPAVYTPNVRSFIPLLYVAWADGLLSPSEVDIIRDKVQSLQQLTPAERDQILRWADPSEWPDEHTFQAWKSLMTEAGKQADFQSVGSIVDLGLSMAQRASVAGNYEGYEETKSVLEALDQALELPGLARFRAIPPVAVDSQAGSKVHAARLQALLDGERADVMQRLKNLLADPVFAREPMPVKEDRRRQVLHWLQELARQGYGSLGFPAEYGGEGSIINYAAVFEVLSMHDLSLAVKFGVQFGLFGSSVQHLGSRPHHEKYLQKIGQGDLLGCFAMTETGHGSNVRDVETTATYRHETRQIEVHSPNHRAGKEYIGNALHAQLATVFAQLIVDGEEHGVHAVLVPLRDTAGNLLPGITVEDNGYKMGLNGVDNGRIWFDHVRVPVTNLLDRFGRIDDQGQYHSEIKNPGKRFFTMLGTLVAGRICVAKGGLSAAKSALAIAIRYALRRRQFGPKGQQEMLLLDYPSHQRRLIPPLARAYACHFALEYVVRRYEHRTDEDGREVESLAAGIKAYTTWFANDTIQACREACGGKGYLWVNRFADLKADADIFATFEGDNTVLLQLVAKALLSDFKEEFSGAGFLGVIRFLANQVSDSFLTINPIYKRKTDANHLNDPAFHRHAFEFRERKILFTLGSRMRNMFRKRIPPYEVFLRGQNHMIALATAHIERVILQQFQLFVDQVEDDDQRKLLEDICCLFALETMEANRGWYLEHDYLEGIKTKAIRRRIDRLCAALRSHNEALVDAFGIPDGLLSAPIALQYKD